MKKAEFERLKKAENYEYIINFIDAHIKDFSNCYISKIHFTPLNSTKTYDSDQTNEAHELNFYKDSDNTTGFDEVKLTIMTKVKEQIIEILNAEKIKVEQEFEKL